MHANVETARQILVETLRKISPDFPNSQADALKFSIITDKSKIPKQLAVTWIYCWIVT
jgi:hypothetical protein